MTHTPSPQSFANPETFSRLLASSPRPALVWYGPDEQRIELSGKVLENWIAKSANLFVDELDAAHGDLLDIASEPHWRSIAAVLGALRAGCVVAAPDEPAPTFWLGFEADDRTATAESAVFMTRSALALKYDGATDDWPEGSVDYCAEIRSFGDLFDPIDAVIGTHVIGSAHRDGSSVRVTLSDWLAMVESWSTRTAESHGAGSGVLVDAGSAPLTLDFLARACGVMAAGKALVLVDSGVVHDEDRLTSIAAEEKADPLG